MAVLQSFFVFSGKHGLTEETENEKVFFYYPTDAPPDERMNEVGLCQSLLGFAEYVLSSVPAG